MKLRLQQPIGVLTLAMAILALGAGASAPRAEAAVGDNLLANPGLESGSGAAPASWTFSAWGTSIAAGGTWSLDAHTGVHSVRVDITSYTTEGDAKWSPAPVAVTGGAYYALSDWYRGSATSAYSVEYWTAGQPTTGDGNWVNLFSGIAPASSWTQFRTGFTMPADAVAAIFVHRLVRAGYLETDDYAMSEQAAPPGFSSPMISLTFDDGSQGDYDRALPLLNARGFATTQYIPTLDLLNRDYSFMLTPAELTTMAQQGHEIGSHSITHPDLTLCNPTCPAIVGVPQTTLGSELGDSKAFLQGLPGVGAVTSIAYPYGSYDANVIAAAQAAGYASARSTEAGYNSPASLQRYDVQVQNMTPAVTIEQFRGWVDYAVAHRYWLVIVYHEVWPDGTPACAPSGSDGCVDAYDTTVGAFRAQLDYVASSGIAVRTVSDALAAATRQNHAPSAGDVTIAPGTPTAADALTATAAGFTDPDGDALGYTYTWKVGANVLQSGASAILGAGRLSRGDLVTVTVTASDPGGLWASASASASVVNAPPVRGVASIAPTLPRTNDLLTATASGFTDPDGDALAFAYAWKVNGHVVAGASGERFSLALPGHGDRGDVITVTATATDGHSGSATSEDSPPATVQNSPPTAGIVTVDPDTPQSGATLTATPTGFTDPDAGDVLGYRYQWYLDNAPLPGATGSSLVLAADMRGMIRVDVAAVDGHGGASDAIASPTLAIADRAPLAGEVAIAPESPATSAMLTATTTGFVDPDGDTLSYAYQWSVNGIVVAGATAATFDLSASGHGDHGDTVSVSVSAEDGRGGVSTPANARVLVANSSPAGGSVTIAPSVPRAGVALTATPGGFSDADGDALTYAYGWYVDGAIVTGAAGPSLDGKIVSAGATVRVEVTAKDGHGGLSEAAAATVSVPPGDRTAPSIAISSPLPRTYRVGARVSVGFSCADDAGLARCTATLGPAGHPAAAVRDGQTVRLSSLGRYVLTVTAADTQGNTSSRAVTLRSAGEKVPPTIAVRSPRGRTFRAGTRVHLRFSCRDNAGIASCRATLTRPRGGAGAVRSGRTVTLSSPGGYVLRIRAVDLSGNAATRTLRLRVMRP